MGEAVVPISLAGQEYRCWETASQGDYESQAEDPSLVHVAPAMLGSLSQAPGLEFLTAVPTLPQMPAAWGDPMGVSDRYLETTAFDGRVSGSMASVQTGGDERDGAGVWVHRHDRART